MIKKLIIILLFFGSLGLCTFTTFNQGNGFYHPDESSTYLIARNIFLNHSDKIPVSYNSEFNTNAFTPSLLYYNKEKKEVVPREPYALYYLVSVGFIFGPTGPFIIISILSWLSVIACYYLAKELFDQKVALFSAIIYGYSAPLIYWANSLYGNLPALTFLLFGLYFVIKIIKYPQTNCKNYIYSSIFLGLSFSIRYEYLIFIAFFSPLLFIFRNIINKYYLAIFLLILLLFSSVLVIKNYDYYGSFIPQSYISDIETSNVDHESTNLVSSSSVSYIINGFKKVYLRFFTQDISPNLKQIKNNFGQNFLMILPVQICFSIFGLITILKQKNKLARVFSFLFTVLIIVWSYDTLGGYHWGEGEEGIGLVYIRYLSISYLWITILFATYLIPRINNSFFNKLIFCTIILITFYQNSFLLFSEKNNLLITNNQKKFFTYINNYLKRIPDHPIIVSGFYGKAIIDNTVLDYSKINTSNENNNKSLTDIITRLLNKNQKIYLFENITHKSTFLNYANYIESYQLFNIFKVQNFIDNSGQIQTLYKIELLPIH